MDVLKDKKYKSYDYTCRYSPVPYYYNSHDNKYIYGVSLQISNANSYVAHKTKDTDTLDYLALKYYGNPTYFWVIASFNDMLDAFEENLSVKYPIIKIPNISSIEFGDRR